MGKALVVKNVDFSSNKLSTITFDGNVPCRGISLNASTIEIDGIGSERTLVATTTPTNTTDAIVWASSNQNVAVVNNGVVTAVSLGDATITATCGNFSASCSVVVTELANVSFGLNMYVSKDANKDYLTGGSALDKYATVYSETGTLKLTSKSLLWYPIQIPDGANKMIITAPGAYQTYGFWMNANTPCSASHAVALAYDADSFGSGVAYSGPRTVNIPNREEGTYQGMNAVAIMLRYNATVTDSDVENVTIEFTA